MAQTPTKHTHDDDDEPKRSAPLAGVLPQPEPALGERLVGAIGVKGEHIDDGERDPDTIAEEQRRRSAEIEKVGVDAYMKAHSTAIPDEDRFPKQVAGVTPSLQKDAEPHHARK